MKSDVLSWLHLAWLLPCLPAALSLLGQAAGGESAGQPDIRAVRLPKNPIIIPGMPNLDWHNINGPSLVRAPGWLEKPLGRYYLYFGNHAGKLIRLAYADDLAGPWTVHHAGALLLEQTPGGGHIASPDVHVDEQRKEVRMYFHVGSAAGQKGQRTLVATSADGLEFAVRPEPIGPFYFRVFRHGRWHYAIAKKGNSSAVLLRSADGLTPFEEGPTLIPRCRHTAMKVDGGSLWLLFTRIGDTPEHILASRIDLSRDWTEWESSMSPPVCVLKPEMDYEGIEHPVGPSSAGAATNVRQLRDPAIYTEGDRDHLLYSVAGECGIAIAELILPRPAAPKAGR